MAKIISPVWSIISGSIAGTTYLTRPDSTIVARQRNKPTNKRSNRQTQVRSNMVLANAAWEGLTDAQRVQWDMYASIVGFQTGRTAFMGGYILAEYLAIQLVAGNAITAVPPTLGNSLNLAWGGFNTPVGPGTGIAFSIINEDTDDAMVLVDVSPGFNPTRNSYKGPWDPSLQQFVACANGASTNVEVLDLVVDQKYFVRIRGVADGGALRISAPWIASQIAVTVP